MPTQIHFIDVGQGNMTLLQLADGKTYLYDCNVTNKNEAYVLNYLREHLGGWDKKIDVFVCSHRDADHMRGVQKVHELFPIQHIWDSGAVGTTPGCTEYREFMDLRRKIGFTEVQRLRRWDFGNTRLRLMNSKNDELANNPNAQSIVMKVVHRDARSGADFDSVMLTGDTDAVTWKEIGNHYKDDDLSCSLLLASHHGSLTYFDDPADTHYYTNHIQAKAPAMTIISVGDNAHGHPHDKSLEFYERHSTGSSGGHKVWRTDVHGTMHLQLKDGGGWSLSKSK